MSVDTAWQRVVDWCEHNAPRTRALIRSPAPAARLTEVQQMFDRPWPADLRRWYELQDGVGAGALIDTPLPRWTMYSLDDIAEQTEFYRDMFDDPEMADPDDVAAQESEEAGSTAYSWLSSFVLICHDITACALYVDLRPGEHHGCVSKWDRDIGGSEMDAPAWASVTAMLEETATSLETNTPCDGLTPVVQNGELSWGDGE